MRVFSITIGACAALALFACATGPAEAPRVAGPIAEAARATTAVPSAAARIKADVDILADDGLEGREAGTRGYDAAADYVAARMAAIGLEPGAKDGWFQTVTLRASRPILGAATFTVVGPDGAATAMKNVEDYMIFPSADRSEFTTAAPAAFVGYGVVAPEIGHDDYAGLDVDGKIVVMFSGAPAGLNSEVRAHYSGGGAKSAEAARRGAVGVVTLLSKAGEERFPWDRMTRNPTRASLDWVGPDNEANSDAPGILGSAIVNPAESAVLFAGAPRSFADLREAIDSDDPAPQGFPLPVRIEMAGALEFEDETSANVLGVVPGADPRYADEYVVLTAHLDHIGVNERLVEAGEDGINNGAMDNALGVAVMLEVARQLSKEGAPARSVLVAAVTAEEKGLIGSDYLAHFPPMSRGRYVANINLDMPLMLHSFRDVVAFGGERSSIGPLAADAVAAAGATLSPDPIPEQGIFTRSDHYRFVQQGVPSIFLWPGFANGGEEQFNAFFAEHYHRPSDEPDLPVLYDDVARFADVNAAIAEAIANAAEAPTWNEGDFFGELYGR